MRRLGRFKNDFEVILDALEIIHRAMKSNGVGDAAAGTEDKNSIKRMEVTET